MLKQQKVTKVVSLYKNGRKHRDVPIYIKIMLDSMFSYPQDALEVKSAFSY